MAGSPHVLIVESEYLLSWHLSHLLQDWGYKVTEWRNRQPQYLTDLADRRPNLILLNPGLREKVEKNDLLEVFILSWNVPVILLSTTRPSEGWLGQIAVSTLSKPFTAGQLREKMEETLQ